MSSSDPMLTEAQHAKLKLYELLLLKWQHRFNLVGSSTLSQIPVRHFRDSSQLLPLAGPWERWIDIGSGAGFPGMVVAILSPTKHVHMVEADKRKASFLAEVSRETGVRVHLHVGRIERILPDLVQKTHFDIVSARALAPLKDLLRLADPVLKHGGRGLFLKGKDLEPELTEAELTSKFRYDLIDSVTERGAKVVIVHGLRP